MAVWTSMVITAQGSQARSPQTPHACLNSRCLTADGPAGVERDPPSPHKPRTEAHAGWGPGSLPPGKEHKASPPSK